MRYIIIINASDLEHLSFGNTRLIEFYATNFWLRSYLLVSSLYISYSLIISFHHLRYYFLFLNFRSCVVKFFFSIGSFSFGGMIRETYFIHFFQIKILTTNPFPTILYNNFNSVAVISNSRVLDKFIA